MLLNEFYTLINCDFKQGTTQFKARVKLISTHPVYKGHFPEIPIAPGVCLTEMIKEILAAQLQRPLVLSSADNIKFLVLINPDEHSEFDLVYQLTDAGDDFAVSCTYVNGETTFLKFKGKFKSPH